MGINIEPYSPCPCGSGKKYKFCCYLKRDEARTEGGVSPCSTSSFFNREADVPAFSDNPEGHQLFTKGMRLMSNGEYKAAIPLFKQSIKKMPLIYSPVNNLAICLFVTNQLDEAIRVQSESLETDPFPNPFGLANLAYFYYIKGDEFRTKRFIKEALESEIPSADACVKVCEMLARFKRHQDIIDFASTTEFQSDSSVCFYTGVAAANLGDKKHAKNYLRKVPIGYHKASMAQRYLEHLRENTSPHTVGSDWPYLLSYEICPLEVLKSIIILDEETWINNLAFVDFCEAILNEIPDDTELATNILSKLKHPSATKMLLAIVKGSFGPDALRFEALCILKESGKIDQDQSIKMHMKGNREKVSFKTTSLNSDFSFGDPLPPKLDKQNIKAIKLMQKRNPDWKSIDEIHTKIMRERPEFYPARYNYAISLLRRGRTAEAKLVVEELVEKYPEYLFARSTLIQLLLNEDRVEKAEELITSMPDLEETHPDTMAVWMIGQALYFEHIEDYEEAFECVRSAHNISPDLQAVKNLWERYEKEED